MTRMTQDQIRCCRTLCECGMCGLPVRLAPAEFEPSIGRTFSIKAGDALLLMSLRIYPANRFRENAVLIGDLSGRLPFSAARRLSPEQAIQFIQDLGIPDEFFKSVLVAMGWIKPLVACDEPPDGWLEADHDEPPDEPDDWLEAAYESREPTDTELDDWA
jgi:hypothetical protein